MVRHAVLRAISCEVIPAKEGPVLFSSASSSVLSHAFSLRDSRARGSRRQYAILLLSKERHPLVQHWAVLQERVQDIITSLQKKAEGKYEMDCKSLAELKEKCDYVRETDATKSSSSFSRRRASSKPARGLREVTQDEQVFEGIHQDLVAVLALAERCLKEQVLSGQPLLSSVRGSGTTPLAVVRDIMGQVPETSCRLLLYRLLSGQTIQVVDQQYHSLHLSLPGEERATPPGSSHQPRPLCPPAPQPCRLTHLLCQPRPHWDGARADRAWPPGGQRTDLHLLRRQAGMHSNLSIVDSEQILPNPVQSECASGDPRDASEDRGGEGFASRAYLCKNPG